MRSTGFPARGEPVGRGGRPGASYASNAGGKYGPADGAGGKRWPSPPRGVRDARDRDRDRDSRYGRPSGPPPPRRPSPVRRYPTPPRRR